MSAQEFEKWERSTAERFALPLMLCKVLGAVMLGAWAASIVWVSETSRRRVECIYNAESVEAWEECGEVTKLERLVRALNGALIDF